MRTRKGGVGSWFSSAKNTANNMVSSAKNINPITSIKSGISNTQNYIERKIDEHKINNQFECEYNEDTFDNTSNIDSINDTTEMHQIYQKCCPKTTFGFKNSEPFCRKISDKFKNINIEKNNQNEAEYNNGHNNEFDSKSSTPKSWWNPFGGKSKRRKVGKSRKNTNKRRK